MIESEGIIDNPTSHSGKNTNSRYDEGYFHGQGSGYGAEGYENEHADWSELIQWVQLSHGKPVRWLDIGCAYGYLIEQAAELDVEAYGIDISSYALRQIKKVRGNLIQGLAGNLPFLENTFDIVSLFDLIEHLENPNSVMEAVESCLKPEGICFLSTPDPIYFQREEPTHIHEHPPSCWVDWLKDRGWEIEIRFGNQPYELEMAACRKPGKSWETVRTEFRTQRAPLTGVISQQGEKFYCVARTPNAPVTLKTETQLYLLNESSEPQQYKISLVTDKDTHPHIFTGNLKLRYLGSQKAGKDIQHQWSPVSLPPGGHDMILRVENEPVRINQFNIEAHNVDRERFLQELSFDHYQRYRSVASLLNQISHESLSVLDVGGALGHLHLFAGRHRVTVLDRAWEDWPGSLSYTGSTIPFGDRSFDVVVSIDTLEHIPAGERMQFMSELCRLAKQTVILCGPFNQPCVAEAESALRDFLRHHLHRQDRFLEEHALYTLPGQGAVLEMLRNQGLSTFEFSNGYLPRWLSMQMASFALNDAPELVEGARNLNALYNQNYYEADNQSPSYRTIIAAFRDGIPGSIHAIRTGIERSESQAGIWPLADLIVSLSTIGLLREKETYLNDQGERLSQFLDHLKNLESTIQEDKKHASNLDDFLKKNTKQLDSLQQHGNNLTRLLETQKKERENLQALIEQAQKRNEDISKHAENLESLMQSQQKHAANLEAMLKENQKHTRNLEQLNQHKEHLFKEWCSRLGIEPAGPIQDGLSHAESYFNQARRENQQLMDTNRNLENANQDLTNKLQTIFRTRLYRIFHKLGWTPIKEESKDE